jgi:lipoate-protein ligase A
MRVLDLSHATPGEIVARDDAMLREAEAQEQPVEVLRFWESSANAVVVGRSGAPEVEAERCARDGLALVRRSSGGGAVVLGPGCLGWSLVLSLERRPELRDVGRSYRRILEPIARALGVELQPPSDLAVDGRKISGNAQRRLRRALLHHGTILYDFDLGAVERYLREPSRQPAYRAGRPHRDFLANLDLPVEEIKRQIAGCCLRL